MDKTNPSFKLTCGIAILVASVIGAYYLYYNSKKEKQKNYQSDDIRKPSLQQQRETINKIKLQGNQLFISGEYEKAIECYIQALKNCPFHCQIEKAILYQNKSAALFNMDKFDEALLDVNKALEISPRYKNALIRRSKIYEIQGLKQEALFDIAAAVIFDSSEQSDSINRMNEIIRNISIDNVEKELEKIPILQSDSYIQTYFESFPTDPLVTVNNNTMCTGLLNDLPSLELVRSGRYEESFQTVQLDLRKSDLTEEALSYLYLLRGTFYLLSCKEDLALSDLDRVIESKHSTPCLKINAIIKRASIMLLNNNMLNVKEQFREAIELDSKCPDIYYHRASMFEMVEQQQAAMRDYKVALKLHNNYTCATADGRVNSYTSEDGQESDFQLFQSLVSQFPDCIEAHRIYIKLLMEENRLDEAEEASKSVLLKFPNCSSVILLMALIKIDQDRNEDAIRILSEALERVPSHAESYHVLAEIFIKNGELEKAVDHLDRAIRCAKSRKDMREYFELREGILAQLNVATTFGIDVIDVMNQMSQGALFPLDM